MKNNIINYAAGLFGIAAVTGLALSATTYLGYARETHARERDELVNTKMVDVLFANDLLQRLNDNQLESVKLRLNDKVTQSLAAIDGLQPAAAESTKVLATIVSGKINHARKQHPEIYPGTTQPTV